MRELTGVGVGCGGLRLHQGPDLPLHARLRQGRPGLSLVPSSCFDPAFQIWSWLSGIGPIIAFGARLLDSEPVVTRRVCLPR